MAHLASRRVRALALPVGLALTASLGFLAGRHRLGRVRPGRVAGRSGAQLRREHRRRPQDRRTGRAGHREGRRHDRRRVRADRRPRRPLAEPRLRPDHPQGARSRVGRGDPHQPDRAAVDHRRRLGGAAPHGGGGGRRGRGRDRLPGPAGAAAVGPARHQGGQGPADHPGQPERHGRRDRHGRRRHPPGPGAELRRGGLRQLRLRRSGHHSRLVASHGGRERPRHPRQPAP